MIDSEEHTSCLQLEAFLEKDINDYSELDLDAVTQRQKLETNIQSKFSRIRALNRDLELLVDELDTDEEQQHVARLLSQHTSEYNRLQQAFKAAAVHRRRRALDTAQQERQQLLGTPNGTVCRRQLQNDSDMVSSSENITESLRRTRQIMAEEVAHTSAVLASMEVSNAQLTKTRDEYLGQHAHLGRSKNLLRTIEWQNKSDVWLLWAGLILFAIVSLYIAQKRVAYFVPESMRPLALVKSAVSIAHGGGDRSLNIGPSDGGGDRITLLKKLTTPPIAPVKAPSQRQKHDGAGSRKKGREPSGGASEQDERKVGDGSPREEVHAAVQNDDGEL